MKKLLISNLLLSGVAVLTANTLVNSSLETVSKRFEIKVKNRNNIESVSSNKFISKKNNKYEDIENLNFIPTTHASVYLKDKNSKIEFIKDIKKESEILEDEVSITLSGVKKSTKDSESKIISKNQLELDYKEIDDQSGYSVNKIKHISYANLLVSPYDYSSVGSSKLVKKVKNKSERISKKELVTKTNIEEKSETKINNNDELTFFSYEESQPEHSNESLVNNIAEVNVVKSDAMKSPIKKGISNYKITHSNSVSTPKLDFSNIRKDKVRVKQAANKIAKIEDTNKIIDAKESEKEAILAAFNKTAGNDEYACLDEKSAYYNRKHSSQYIIGINSILRNERQFKKIHNFELRFQDDIDDIAQDFGEGEIKLTYDMNTHMSTRRAVIYTKNHVPTSLDFVFEPGNMEATIPVLHNDTFNKIIVDQKLKALGGNILVELDDLTEDVDLDVDTNYEAKLFIDADFKVVDRNTSDYSYIFFIGVDTGNTIIYFKNVRSKVSNKIIHVAADEIYYEPNFFAHISKDSFSLYEENLLSKCKSMLNIQKNDITTWSYDGKVSKSSLNKQKISKMVYPLGTRKYYELKHLNESIFIGRWNAENIIVPSESYIDHVMSNFDMNVNPNQCIVQLNMSKKAKNIFINGLAQDGIMSFEKNILDNDGVFYKDFSANSERVFVLGEKQGVFNIKLEYVDGTVQFLQSYCSDATYLIEQL